MMKAMILAAGRGERMGSLTDYTPKPLLQAGGRMLIEYQLRALAAAGVEQIVINHAHHGDRIEAALGDGAHYGVEIRYSPEPAGALETGGGIRHALPLLGDDRPFIVVNADIWTDFPFATLPEAPPGLVHLVLVNNPPHHPEGDFALEGDGCVKRRGNPMLTYSGIAVSRPELFHGELPERFPLAQLLYAAVDRGRAHGEYYSGAWRDIGTPERLAALRQELQQ